MLKQQFCVVEGVPPEQLARSCGSIKASETPLTAPDAIRLIADGKSVVVYEVLQPEEGESWIDGAPETGREPLESGLQVLASLRRLWFCSAPGGGDEQAERRARNAALSLIWEAIRKAGPGKVRTELPVAQEVVRWEITSGLRKAGDQLPEPRVLALQLGLPGGVTDALEVYADLKRAGLVYMDGGIATVKPGVRA